MLTSRLARWVIILIEFDITFAPQKAIKGQTLADFLVGHPISDDSPLACEFLDQEVFHMKDEISIWKMYFDGGIINTAHRRPKHLANMNGDMPDLCNAEEGIMRHSLALIEPFK